MVDVSGLKANQTTLVDTLIEWQAALLMMIRRKLENY